MKTKIKKTILAFISIVFFTLLATLVLTYLNKENSARVNGLKTASIDLATQVVSLRHTNMIAVYALDNDSRYISKSAINQLYFYRRTLQSLNNATVNITKLYDKSYSSANKPLSSLVESAGVAGQNIQQTNKPSYVMPNDKRLFYKNGGAYIYVKDLNFGSTGSDIVPYDNVNITLTKGSVQQTYIEMQRNPDNVYKLDGYSYTELSNSKKVINVEFSSILSGSTLVVKVRNNGSQVTGFEVN